mmetsp:Transcript_36638/g.103420  ORF Transcript_36638/g.103420 Transcript_36638/m.103420 type:complete len:113 (+) Transcript_36638:520-858(+)
MENPGAKMAAASLMKAATEVLQVPPKVAVTAMLYLHRFQSAAVHQHDSCQVLTQEPFRLVCAALFVASKVNEVCIAALLSGTRSEVSRCNQCMCSSVCHGTSYTARIPDAPF